MVFYLKSKIIRSAAGVFIRASSHIMGKLLLPIVNSNKIPKFPLGSIGPKVKRNPPLTMDLFKQLLCMELHNTFWGIGMVVKVLDRTFHKVFNIFFIIDATVHK